MLYLQYKNTNLVLIIPILPHRIYLSLNRQRLFRFINPTRLFFNVQPITSNPIVITKNGIFMFGHLPYPKQVIGKKSGIRGTCLNIILPKALSQTVFRFIRNIAGYVADKKRRTDRKGTQKKLKKYFLEKI